MIEGRRKKEEGRRKKEEGRRKKEEVRRKKEEGRRKKEEGNNPSIHPSVFICGKKTESAIALAQNILNPRNFFYFFLTFHLTYQRIS
jgi:hypothetical protein